MLKIKFLKNLIKKYLLIVTFINIKIYKNKKLNVVIKT